MLAFVTLVGGAIYYAQAAALGLPADQIVSAMPQSALLVVGARFIIPVLVIVGAPLTLVGLVETRASHRSNAARGVVTVLLGGVGAVFLLVDIARAHGSDVAYAAPLMIWAVLIAIIFFTVVRGQSPFTTYAAVTLTATAVFAAALAIALAASAPAVRAVLVDRTHGPPITGLYAASNSAEVLIGQVCETRQGSRRGSKLSGVVIRVPRDDISAVFVTTNGSIEDAINRQPALFRKVGGRWPPVPKPCTDALPAELERIPHQGVPGVLQGP